MKFAVDGDREVGCVFYSSPVWSGIERCISNCNCQSHATNTWLAAVINWLVTHGVAFVADVHFQGTKLQASAKNKEQGETRFYCAEIGGLENIRVRNKWQIPNHTLYNNSNDERENNNNNNKNIKAHQVKIFLQVKKPIFFNSVLFYSSQCRHRLITARCIVETCHITSG